MLVAWSWFLVVIFFGGNADKIDLTFSYTETSQITDQIKVNVGWISRLVRGDVARRGTVEAAGPLPPLHDEILLLNFEPSEFCKIFLKMQEMAFQSL